jgi:protein O-GlcNAc transferase
MATTAELIDLARKHHQAGDLPQAESLCRQVLQADPGHANALNLLGVIAYQTRHYDVAIALFRDAVAHAPVAAECHANLGLAYQVLGQLEDAAACYEKAVLLQPDIVGVHCELGSVSSALGRPEKAIHHYEVALRLRPDMPVTYNDLGNALLRLGKTGEAVAGYQRALRLKPDYAEAHNNLGNALKIMGSLDEAVACYRRALQLQPEYANAHNNLGNALMAQGRLDEAVASYRRALQCKPESAYALSNLGNALARQGNVDEAVACYRRSLELQPDFAGAHNNLLLLLNYRAGITTSELAEAHAGYERQHAAPLRRAWRPHENSLDPDRRLRLGFLSAELRRHPVGYFTVPVIENLDRNQAEFICYNGCPAPDDVTARFRSAAAGWRNVVGWGEERLAEHVRADRIDVLFDLSGHTSNNWLLVFARKPAPIQVTWCGYSGTTGLAAIDYILADRYVIPPGAESHYAERVLRLPNGYVCYDPPAAAPAASALPALERGYVTFGSFNNPTKLGRQVVAIWAQILRRLPRARLVLKYQWLDDAGVSGRLAAEFAGHGIDADRVSFLGASPYNEFWRAYHDIDVALDTFPFSGGITTCDALWMGVPVITCPGETFAARHSLSHLSNVGLTETIADSVEDYIARAVTLANDLPRLAELRAGLREHVGASPLCDGNRLADNLLRLLRDAWREWVGRAHRKMNCSENSPPT